MRINGLIAVAAALSSLIIPGSAASAQETHSQPAETLSLREAEEMALKHNPDILNSGLDVAAAMYMKQEAFAEYFPKISVNAFSYYAFDPMLEIGIKDILGNNDFSNNLQNVISGLSGVFGFSPVYTTLKQGVGATVSVTQPVFAGGRIVNGNRLAALGVQAARLQKEVKTRTSGEEVEKNYWQVVSLEEKMKTLEQMESLVDTLYKDVSSAREAGIATENDVLQVRLKKNEIQSGKIRVRNGIRLAKMLLFNTIGLKYNPYSAVRNDSIPYIDDILLTDRLGEMDPPQAYYRPEEEIAASQEEKQLLDISVQSKRIEKKMAIGETMPQIGIGASYGYGNVMDKGRFNGAVYAMVRIPISDWGKTSRKIRRYDSYIEKAENERDFLNAQIILQVRQLWFDLTASWEQLQVAKESMEAANSSVRQLSDYYDAGLCPLSELLQAQTKLRETSDQYIDQCISYRTSLRMYIDRAGGVKGKAGDMP